MYVCSVGEYFNSNFIHIHIQANYALYFILKNLNFRLPVHVTAEEVQGQDIVMNSILYQAFLQHERVDYDLIWPIAIILLNPTDAGSYRPLSSLLAP